MLPVTIESRWEYVGDEVVHVVYQSGDDVFYEVLTEESPGFWRRVWSWIRWWI